MSIENSIRVKCSKCGVIAKGKKSHLDQEIKCPKCSELCIFSEVCEEKNEEVTMSQDSKTLIDQYEEEYHAVLKTCDNEVKELIANGKEMKAVFLFGQMASKINEIHESLHDFYSFIFNGQEVLERFESERLQELGHAPKATRQLLLEGSDHSAEVIEEYVLESLQSLGFDRYHWFFNLCLLAEIEYMIMALGILMEPEFIPLEIESMDDTDESKPNRYIPSSVKLSVWRRDTGKCVDCGSNEKLEYDHIIPVSKGGSNTERNVQLLCEKCNRQKSASIR